MKIWSFIVMLFFLLIFLVHSALPMDKEEWLKNLREIQEKTEDFSADLFQEKKLSLFKEKIVSKGRIRFKKPDKIFIEFFHPESIQIASNGKTLLLYYQEEKRAEYFSLQSNPMGERVFFFSKDPFQEKVVDWKIMEDHKFFWAIEIIPKGRESPFAKTRLRISKKDWTVIGMEMIEKNGDTTVIHYSNIKVNQGLKDSDFEVHLPKDVKVIKIR